MTITTLRATIENFHSFILDKQNTIIEAISGPDLAFKETRLDVYYEGYALRLLEILQKTFPMVEKFMGEEAFEMAGRDYIASYPSEHFSVRYFGRKFADFLSEYPQAEPWWSEMAKFEWTLEDVVDAPDAPQITFADLAALQPEDWAELRLLVHPSLQIVPFSYPTPRIWQSVHLEQELPPIEKTAEPVQWLIWRFQLRSHFCPTTPEQLWIMRAFQEGQKFADICTGLSQWLSEADGVNLAAVTLRQWVEEGVFSEILA